MRILIAAAMFSVLALSPASAAMMACTADNMMKSTAMMAPGERLPTRKWPWPTRT